MALFVEDLCLLGFSIPPVWDSKRSGVSIFFVYRAPEVCCPFFFAKSTNFNVRHTFPFYFRFFKFLNTCDFFRSINRMWRTLRLLRPKESPLHFALMHGARVVRTYDGPQNRTSSYTFPYVY